MHSFNCTGVIWWALIIQNREQQNYFLNECYILFINVNTIVFNLASDVEESMKIVASFLAGPPRRPSQFPNTSNYRGCTKPKDAIWSLSYHSAVFKTNVPLVNMPCSIFIENMCCCSPVLFEWDMPLWGGGRTRRQAMHMRRGDNLPGLWLEGRS